MSCPICAKAAAPEYRPFCSRRCADVDLGRWLTGSYILPGEPAEANDDPAAPEEAQDRQGRARPD